MYPELKIERFYLGQEIKKDDGKQYRSLVNFKNKYCYRLLFQYSDLFVISDIDIYRLLGPTLMMFYDMIGKVIEENPLFKKSLKPVKPQKKYPHIIKKMCEASIVFDVGPMASVAGALCDYMARELKDSCKTLIIENGGDIYIKEKRNIKISLSLNNKYFNNLLLEIDKTSLPAGICASSGTIGHSLSFGTSDLVAVTARSAVTADAAATAIANTIKSKEDIKESIDQYKSFKAIDAIVSIKDDIIGIWGKVKIIKQ